MLPSFETARLILRPMRLEDAPSYQKNFNDYEVIRHLSAKVPWPYPDDGVKFFLETIVLPNIGKTRWTWGIALKNDPEDVVGCVDVFSPGIPEHRGFWLARRLWGQGLMTEAVIPVMDYAFSDLGFESMILSNALGNHRSRRVKEKTGATLFRVVPSLHVDPALTHSEHWQISKEEWLKFRANA
jgi:ribosomal-protein-alanine N-acetyltransferase